MVHNTRHKPILPSQDAAMLARTTGSHGGRMHPAVPPGHRCAAGGVDENRDDDLLATILIRMWTLASGRTLPPNTAPTQMTENELVEFWADDFSVVIGRHARASAPAAADEAKDTR